MSPDPEQTFIDLRYRWIDYRAAVATAIHRAGYSQADACRKVRGNVDRIKAAFDAEQSAADCAAAILALEGDDNDAERTPILVESERKEAALTAIEEAMEEGR